MWLVGADQSRVALCYSMNVHPGEGLDDLLAALRATVVPLKARLASPGPFAVGLRLARRAAEEAEERADELKAALAGAGLQAVTANAFPYGDFHAARVKEAVYRPDWSDARRAVYSLRVAVLLAALNPTGASVSFSTLPLCSRDAPAPVNALVGRLLEMVHTLQAVERKSGVRVRLALEPEPFCRLETARDTAAFFRDHLLPACRARYGRGAEDLARAHLGVCLDTCHHAVMWEGGVGALQAYRDAGIPIAKLQLSSALEAAEPEAFVPFAEPRYLHQVVARSGEGRIDLPAEGLKGPVRCHFHVPIHKEAVGGVRTTRDDLTATLRHALATGAAPCLEIETYTWDLLPAREGSLVDSLEQEYRWVLGEARACGFLPEGVAGGPPRPPPIPS
ncbi:MAG: metabolite traffic protein EboE [Planctomycetaceae bacterium]